VVALAVVFCPGRRVALGFGIVAARRAAEARLAQGRADAAREKSRGGPAVRAAAAATAEESQHQAEAARQTAQAERGRAEREHDRAERFLYARQIALAQREWEANNVGSPGGTERHAGGTARLGPTATS